jgi:hypothetical protein
VGLAEVEERFLEEGNVLFDSLGIIYFETLESIFGLADVGVGGTVDVLHNRFVPSNTVSIDEGLVD